MRNYIDITQTLVEAEQVEITPDQLIAIAKSIHHTEQDFEEGNLVNRIWKFTKYVLKSLPVEDLTAPWTVYDELVAEYASRFQNGETPPPIIYDDVDDVVIDGTHRIRAADAAGVPKIAAYVGLEANLDPYWGEDENDE